MFLCTFIPFTTFYGTNLLTVCLGPVSVIVRASHKKVKINMLRKFLKFKYSRRHQKDQTGIRGGDTPCPSDLRARSRPGPHPLAAWRGVGPTPSHHPSPIY